MSLRGNGTCPKFTVLVHLWAQFTTGKHKILPKTKIFPQTASLGISNHTDPRSHVNLRILLQLILKKHFWGPKWAQIAL